MKIKTLAIQKLEIPFKLAFKHSSATRLQTEAVIVVAESARGNKGYGEGCPRSYVTGETLETAFNFFKSVQPELLSIANVDQIQAWVAEHQQALDKNPAAWCAVELALLDLIGKENQQPVETLLSLPELSGDFCYTAVLGVNTLPAFKKQLEKYVGLGFTDFKVKVSGNIKEDQERILLFKNLPEPIKPPLDSEPIKTPLGAGPIKNPLGVGPIKIPLDAEPIKIRLDANNLWHDAQEAIDYIEKLSHPFFAIEEPLQTGDYDGCKKISQTLKIPIILDESFTRIGQFESIHASPENWIVNLRISKMGGLLRSLAIAEQAQRLQIPIIIGAQVGETSILTRAALTVANAYREILLGQEGAFGTHLLEHDFTEPSIMFGKKGLLSATPYSKTPGLTSVPLDPNG